MNKIYIQPNKESSITLDVSIVESLNSPIGLSLSLKMKRPRFPYTDRVWSPGNKAYLLDKGYTVEPTHYIVEDQTGISLYKSTLSTKVISNLHGFIGAGFYHKWVFRTFWSIMWKIIAKSSGLPEFKAYTYNNMLKQPKPATLSPDVLVVGGGLSGLAAASKSLEKGAKVVLVDDHNIPGGFYRYLPSMKNNIDKLTNVILKKGSIILTNSKFLGRFVDGYAITSPGTFYIVKPKSIIYATGGINPIPLYENNDLPGTIDLEMMLKLASRKPELLKKSIILGCPHALGRIAEIIGKIGSTVICHGNDSNQDMNIEGVNFLDYSGRLLKALGGNRVEKVVLEDERKIDASFVVSGYTPFPDINLVIQDGGKPLYLPDFNRFTVQHNGLGMVRENVFVAGLAAGFFDEKCAIRQSEIAGLLAVELKVEAIQSEVDDFISECKDSIEVIKESNSLNYTLTPAHIDFWETKNSKGLQFIDWDIDITIEDVIKAYDEGYNVMELIKRYTGIGTAAEQGRLTIPTTIMLLSALKGISLSKLGWFHIRPPHMLPTIGELAVEVE